MPIRHIVDGSDKSLRAGIARCDVELAGIGEAKARLARMIHRVKMLAHITAPPV